MRVFYDFEFAEDGRTIDSISLGMVREDGAELYHQNRECHFKRCNLWVKANVLPHLQFFDAKRYRPIGLDEHGSPNARHIWASRKGIAAAARAFCDPDRYGPLELWGYYSSYDHVALAQLFGTLMDLPKGWPMWTNDLQQWAQQLGVSDLSQRVPQTDEHLAIADARWNRAAYMYLATLR